MNKSLTLCLTLFIGFALKSQAQEPLKLVVTTPVPGYSGDFDHFAADLKGNRLFVAAEDQRTVEVFDLQTGKRIHSIAGFMHPHTMAFLPDSGNLIVTDGDDVGRAALVDLKTYRIIGAVSLPPGVDHGVLDPSGRYYYVQSSSPEGANAHVISIVDTEDRKVVGEISGIPGPDNEGMIFDRAGKKLYINLTGTDEIGIVDVHSKRLVAHWPLPGVHTAHGIDLDEPDHRLFTASRKPARFIVFNTDTGKVVAELPCVGVNSNLWFDAAHKRIYVTGDGTISVFKQSDADHYQHIAEIPSAYRAKTSIFVPELNRLYVADSSKGRVGTKMALQIFAVQP